MGEALGTVEQRRTFHEIRRLQGQGLPAGPVGVAAYFQSSVQDNRPLSRLKHYLHSRLPDQPSQIELQILSV